MAKRLRQHERRERTRRRLLDSARAVFGRRGFGAATLDEIAEAAGLTRGALYYNFPGGKDELFVALLDERRAERASAIKRAFGASDAGLDETVAQAREAAHDAAASMRTNREWQLLIFEFALHAARERRFRRLFGRRETVLRRALVDVIESRVRELDIELPVSAESLALGIIALGNGLALEALVDEAGVPENLFEELIGFLVLGVATALRASASATAPAPPPGSSRRPRPSARTARAARPRR